MRNLRFFWDRQASSKVSQKTLQHNEGFAQLLGKIEQLKLESSDGKPTKTHPLDGNSHS